MFSSYHICANAIIDSEGICLILNIISNEQECYLLTFDKILAYHSLYLIWKDHRLVNNIQFKCVLSVSECYFK